MLQYTPKYYIEGFEGSCRHMTRDFLLTVEQQGITEVGDWQSMDVSAMPQGKTVEMRNVVLEYEIPEYREVDQDADEPAPPACQNLDDEVDPNQPFAELQFQDRVSGKPLNPPPSFEYWPWRARGEEHKNVSEGKNPCPCGKAWSYTQCCEDDGGTLPDTMYCKRKHSPANVQKFSHTYPERFWPKTVGYFLDDEGLVMPGDTPEIVPAHGIRYPYGDLNDLVSQLARSPATRQAYLPVWFPEDTGAVQSQRVPCSLGYHFLLRGDSPRLHCTYFIRSVDFLRHFRDDVYMAARLTQWVLGRVQELGAMMNVKPGTLTMHMVSFHVFEGDLPRLRKDLRESTKS